MKRIARVPKRYLQGTLDFACAAYAVINALSCACKLDLAGARRIFQETGIALAEYPALWRGFMRNETDHYWLVRYMLHRWCRAAPWKLRLRQPFSDCLLPDAGKRDLGEAELFLPEQEDERGPPLLEDARQEAASVWERMEDWLDGREKTGRAALLRFHRFLWHNGEIARGRETSAARDPAATPRRIETRPRISHWTCADAMDNGLLRLHDASSEANALLGLKAEDVLPEDGTRGLVRIVPESLVLLEPEP